MGRTKIVVLGDAGIGDQHIHLSPVGFNASLELFQIRKLGNIGNEADCPLPELGDGGIEIG
ncbi:hypothetical protein D3C72_2441420 [compost metagenome]